MIVLLVVAWSGACVAFLAGAAFGRMVERSDTADRFDDGYQAALHALQWLYDDSEVRP